MLRGLQDGGAYIRSLVYYSSSGGIQRHLVDTTLSVYQRVMSKTRHCREVKGDNHVGFSHMSPCGHLSFMTKEMMAVSQWEIHVATNLTINMSFTAFIMEESMHECGFEALELKCKEKQPLFCGSRDSWQELCLDNHVRLKYAKRMITQFWLKRNYDRRKRFVMTYQIIDKAIYKEATQIYEIALESEMTPEIGWDMFQGSGPEFESHASVIILTEPLLVLQVQLAVLHNMSWGSDPYRPYTGDVDKCLHRKLYDGPSRLSSPLTELRFNTSGFVLTIDLIHKSNCPRFALNISYTSKIQNYKFTQTLLNITAEDSIVAWKYSLPSTLPSNFYVEGIRIKNAINGHVHIYLDSLESTSPVTMTCIYWGLVIFDSDRLDVLKRFTVNRYIATIILRPMLRLCKTVWKYLSTTTNRLTIPSSMVTATHSADIVVYAYRMPGMAMQVSVLSTHTPCRGRFASCQRLWTKGADVPTGPDLAPGNSFRGIPYRTQADESFANLALFPVVCGASAFGDNHQQYRIHGSVGDQCVKQVSSRKRTTNSFSLTEEGCNYIQYFPSYSHINYKALNDECLILVFHRDSQELFVNNTDASIEDARVCEMPRPLQVILKDTGSFFTVDLIPSCTSIIIKASSTPIPIRMMKDSSTDYLKMYFNSYLFRSVHLSKLLDTDLLVFQHTTPYIYTHYHISQWTFPLIETTDKTKIEANIRINPFAEQYSHVTNNISSIILTQTLSTCEQQCFKLYILHFVPSHKESVSFVPFREIMYYSHLHVCLSTTTDLHITDYGIFSRRMVVIMPDYTLDMCLFKLKFNPFIPINASMIDSYHSVSTGCCEVDIAAMYFVVWKYAEMSWLEADTVCRSGGGRLVRVSTMEDLSIMEHLAMGTRFDSQRTPFISGLRLYPYTIVYMNITEDEVRRLTHFVS